MNTFYTGLYIDEFYDELNDYNKQELKKFDTVVVYSHDGNEIAINTDTF